MRKYVLLIMLMGCVSMAQAQLVKQTGGGQKTQADLDWYNCSYEEDGVYGAEVNKAYEFLKGKKLGKRPVVAIIGTGMDVEHEDLKEAMWTNPKEKADGKDNDKNGWVDDINGWNFLGGNDGRVMEKTMKEGDREFLRLKSKYADYFTNNGKFFKVVNKKLTEVLPPEDLREYDYYSKQVLRESRLARSYRGWQLGFVVQEYATDFRRELEAKYPNRKLQVDDLQECVNPQGVKDSLRNIALALISMGGGIYKTTDLDVVYDNFVSKVVDSGKETYEQELAVYGSDGRGEIVKDDYLNINDTYYGNNVLLTADAMIGTMQAGVIAGKRDNELGGDGVMDKAEVMSLRVSAGSGEPYLKDMALAIRYAVDHGADVVVLPQQNTFYPEEQKQWMIDALRYAEENGALVIVPVWELSQDLSQVTFYPNRWMDGERELTNLMVVASSDKNGNPSMNANYGAKELDLFAPGIDIYSTYMGDTYQTGTGTGLSAATVAGVAALVKAYYPHLSGYQIRKLLLETVTSRADVEVEKGIVVDGKQDKDLFLFGDLCLSGGIINAYRAVVAAEKLGK